MCFLLVEGVCSVAETAASEDSGCSVFWSDVSVAMETFVDAAATAASALACSCSVF